jgi:hypothetical protein
MKAPDQATVDARYQAKLAARATGSTTVIISEPTMPEENPLDPAVVEARYRAKMAARRKADAAPAPAAPPAPAAHASAAHDGSTSSKAAVADESETPKETKSEGPSFSQRQRR